MADGIDLKEFRKLTRDLKAFKPDKEVKKALKLAGQLVADDARLRVEPHSKSIPLTIKVRVRKTSVSVYAGGPGKPLAGLFELGNRGGKSAMTDKFRHPVFGNRKVWVNQSMHPFLYRSMLANASRIEHFEGEIVAGAFREVGWHGA